jgi:MoxR-like ATPase
VAALAPAVLRHRILTNFTAASEGITTDTVIKRILEETPEKEGDLERDERFKKIFAA